jgi:uroporphyrin-III C-methyltransferase
MNKHAVSPVVTLVGAGPGDPDLLTLKAVKALQAATVVLVDDLVHPEVLAHAPAAARIVHVGKRGGCQSTPQAFIEKLMVQAALAGENVVRLKGGDPLVFGRGGEEQAHLQAHGIDVRVVNGITAGLAAAHDLGVSLTHREHAHGVVMVTGHASAGNRVITAGPLSQPIRQSHFPAAFPAGWPTRQAESLELARAHPPSSHTSLTPTVALGGAVGTSPHAQRHRHSPAAPAALLAERGALTLTRALMSARARAVNQVIALLSLRAFPHSRGPVTFSTDDSSSFWSDHEH